MKIFLTTNSPFYLSWIKSRTNVEIVDDVKKADLVFFTGGEDVDPSIYGDEKHRTTYSNKNRDDRESQIYSIALSNKIPMIGICRGSQFLTAVQAGGFLIQDVSNHTMSHEIELYDSGETFRVTSTHHQMMYPFKCKEFELVAFASPRISAQYSAGVGRMHGTPPYEPEIVYYPRTNVLACQMHPEMMNDNDPFVEWLFSFMVKKLGLKI